MTGSRFDGAFVFVLQYTKDEGGATGSTALEGAVLDRARDDHR